MSQKLTRAEKMELLYAALNSDAADEFARLLARHRECRFTEDGNDDHWMLAAASRGKLWAVRLLVEKGADVNQPSNSTDAEPAPEGPLVHACHGGNADLVRYLIDQGATINHTVNNRIRCFALTGAATGGHLDVVKLLIERGAAINAAWTPWTALDYAINYGHASVADYLRSVGGKTGDESGVAADEDGRVTD